MYLYLTLINFLILIFVQIISFKILNLKKKWFSVTFFFHLIISIYFLPYNYSMFNILEYFFLNFLILICYLTFLVLVFSGSPSITLLNNPDKKKFIKSGFIKHRLFLMKKDKLITNKNLVTTRGKLILIGTNLMSDIIFKEND